ncbi:MAG: DUF1566 domain-containing protein [Desulfovibrionales bacterium]|nr:MAG: DUF1566 domain-containing protein [Desulfovibrionales bacterium]
MNYLLKLNTLAIATVLFFSPFAIAHAGSLDSPAPPTDVGSAMYTLEDIYNRLDDGEAGSKRDGSFVEPEVAPTAGTGRTLNEVMGKAPVVDDANGATAADVRMDKTFWGLTRGEWGVKTGTLDTAAIPCSGTRWSNAAITPDGRWCDNGDGTVTDLFGHNGRGKGLVWLKDANWGGKRAWRVNEAFNAQTDNREVFDDAHTRAGILSSGTAGLSDGSVVGDWRLPTREELKALTHGTDRVRYGTPGPFTGIQNDIYWSGTTRAESIGAAWFVFIDTGVEFGLAKTEIFHVWPVRAGQ